jgi:GT2 family glycosyltransferase
MADATLVIATRNRKAELCKALRSALAQTVPLRILVLDDASDDGTADLVAREFPSVALERAERAQGYIAQRNRGARLARTPLVFSLDDDAVFSTPHTVAQTLAEFDHPRVGAVAIPWVNVNRGPEVCQQAPAAWPIYATDAYMGTAHALRRDLFLMLGGYRENLFHQGEEQDYCLRLLGAGFVTRLGRADPIHHFESPTRNVSRMDLYGRRNDVLYAWQNVPWPYLPVHLLGTSFNGLLWGLKVGRPLRMLRGLLNGYLACVVHACGRRPITRDVYRLSRLLKKRGAMPLAEVESWLPAMQAPPQRAAGLAPRPVN